MVSTQFQPKSEIVAARLRDINPDIRLTVINEFLKDERIPELLSNHFDYVVDAIDTLSPKVFLIVHALRRQLPLISSLGAGGKLDPSLIRIDDIGNTYNCNLARMVRKRLTKFDIRSGFKVVFSPELVDKSVIILTEGEQNKKTTVGTISYLPAMFGCYLASQVIRDIINR